MPVRNFSDNFPFGTMGAIVSHPLLREAAVTVFPPLFPSGSGASSTLELTDNKCLKKDICILICIPTSLLSIFWVCAVSSRHGATHISKRCWKAHIFQKACWGKITAELSLHVAAVSVKQLDFWHPDSHFLDRQTGYWKVRGTFRCGEARLNSRN